MVSRLSLFVLVAFNISSVSNANEISVQEKKSSREIKSEIIAELVKLKQNIQNSVENPKVKDHIEINLAVLEKYQKSPELMQIWLQNRNEIIQYAIQARYAICMEYCGGYKYEAAVRNYANILKFEVKCGLYR